MLKPATRFQVNELTIRFSWDAVVPSCQSTTGAAVVMQRSGKTTILGPIGKKLTCRESSSLTHKVHSRYGSIACQYACAW